MERMYEDDLTRATEIVLSSRQRVRRVYDRPPRRRARGSARRAAAGAIGIGSTLGAAISNHRTLGPAEAKVLGLTGSLLLVIVAIAVLWPWIALLPGVIAGVWIGIAAIVKAFHMRPASSDSATARVSPDGKRRAA
jgi:cardiolipin synthase A/B